MELRLLLAFILMGVVLFVTPYFYKTRRSAGEEDGAGGREERAGCRPPPSTHGRPGGNSRRRLASETRPLHQSPRRRKRPASSIPTSSRITFSNRGGVVKSWLLKKHKAAQRRSRCELVNTASHADPTGRALLPRAEAHRGCQPGALRGAHRSGRPDHQLRLFQWQRWWRTNPFSSGNPATCWMFRRR